MSAARPLALPAPLDITEKQFQAQVLKLAAYCGWTVYHTYNSRRSTSGYPDLSMVRRVSGSPKARHVYAELKTQKGRVSKAQYEWLALLTAAGHEVYLWRPADFQQIVEVLK